MTIEIEQVGELPGGSGGAIAVDPSGNTTVAAASSRATVWNGDQLVGTVALTGYRSGPVSFSADGKRAHVGGFTIDLASVTASGSTPSIELLSSGIDFSERAAERFYAAGVSATSGDGGRCVASFGYVPSRGIGDDEPNQGPGGQVVLIDPRTDSFVAVLTDLEDRHQAVAVHITDSRVAVATDVLAVFDTRDGSSIFSVAGASPIRTDVRLSPDSTRVAASRVDGTVELHAVDGAGDAPAWAAHTDRAMAVAFHPRQPWLATGGEDQQVKVWSYEAEGEPELIGWFFAEDDVRALAFHPHGGHLLVAIEDSVLVTEVSTGEMAVIELA